MWGESWESDVRGLGVVGSKVHHIWSPDNGGIVPMLPSVTRGWGSGVKEVLETTVSE